MLRINGVSDKEGIIFETEDELLSFMAKCIKKYDMKYYQREIAKLEKEGWKEENPAKINILNKKIKELTKEAETIQPIITKLNELMLRLEQLCNVLNEPRKSNGTLMYEEDKTTITQVNSNIINWLEYFAGNNNIRKAMQKDNIILQKEINGVRKQIESIIETNASLIKFDSEFKYGFNRTETDWEYLSAQDLSTYKSLKIEISEIIDKDLEKLKQHAKTVNEEFDQDNLIVTQIIKLENGKEEKIIVNDKQNFNKSEFNKRVLNDAFDHVNPKIKSEYAKLENLKEKYDIIYNEKNEIRYFKRSQELSQVMKIYENAALHKLMAVYSSVLIELLDKNVYTNSVAELEKNIIRENSKYEKDIKTATKKFEKLSITSLEEVEIEKLASTIQGKNFENRKADVLIETFEANPIKSNRERVEGLEYYKSHVKNEYEKNNSGIETSIIVDENLKVAEKSDNPQDLNTDNLKPIFTPQELREMKTAYYQEYMFYRIANSDSKIKFSEFLQKNHPDAIDLINIEQKKEQQAMTIYKEYIIYKANQEDKNNCMSFKDFVNSKYMQFDIDVNSVTIESGKKTL